MKNSPISVLGSGAWGTALAVHLAHNGSEPLMWGYEASHVEAMKVERENRRYLAGVKFPESLQLTASLEEAVSDVQDILIVVPSEGFRTTLQKIKPFLRANARIMWATKGLESQTGQFLHQVVAEELGNEMACAVISGPSFAAELGRNQPTAVTVACEDKAFTKDILDRFHRGSLRLYSNEDLIGVQLGGAMKNVMALAAGVSDGLGFGTNAQAALITRGLAEIMRLGDALGAQRETLMGLAGLGDLVLTCTDNLSRNRRYGVAIGQGKERGAALAEIQQVVEGAVTAKAVVQVAKSLDIELPICELVYRVLYEDLRPVDAVDALLNRAPTREF